MKRTLTIGPGRYGKKNGKYTQNNQWSYLEIPLLSSVSWTLPSNSTLVYSKLPTTVPPIHFPSKNSQKNSSFSFLQCCPLPSLYLGFAFSMISTATTFSATSSVSPPCSHLSGRHLFCPIPLAASKSEVDSLWPLRM